MRYGHLNFGELELLKDKAMVNGLPSVDHPNQLCEWCLHEKAISKEFFQKSHYKNQEAIGARSYRRLWTYQSTFFSENVITSSCLLMISVVNLGLLLETKIQDFWSFSKIQGTC